MNAQRSGTDRIAEPWGTRTPFGPGEEWPVRVDTFLAEDVDPDDVVWVRSASVLHSNGDAFDHAVLDGRIVGVRGRAADRVNRGRLGPKDLFGWQGATSRDRLTRPLVREGGELVETDWDTAMGRVVAQTRRLLAEQGPSAIGFYTSGQLLAEEYFTLAAIGHGALALGTNHIDGNTRLCTATAGEALKESFGCDGQPGSYTDVDHADVIALYGHNVAETQTVLWTRMLDRLAGQDPPTLVCVDPRDTPVARAARESGGVHLAPLPGTNVALMNGLLHEIIGHGWIDREWISAHTVGFDDLAAQVADYPPERVGRICGIDPERLRGAARVIGTARARAGHRRRRTRAWAGARPGTGRPCRPPAGTGYPGTRRLGIGVRARDGVARGPAQVLPRRGGGVAGLGAARTGRAGVAGP